ncbi:MAG TPA: sporulation protein YqfD [Syntrophomonadaceae bacterium]|nr:sporulation protein YqfD [Syntrophomonadaceae bacterium]
MSKKIFENLGGMITVRLTGKNLEKVINMAMARGIFIWDIKKNGDGLRFRVRSSGYKALQNISQEGGFELTAVGRQGLPFFKQVLRRRVGFVSGVLFFVLALYLISSFVWFVQVSGNRLVDGQKILQTASHLGVHRAAARWSFDRRAVEEALLREIPELSYVRVNIQGVRAQIEVVEKVLPSQEITGPCHIIAARDAVVDSILVLNGQAHVKSGDVVSRGEILISGLVDPPTSEYVTPDPADKDRKPTPVRARGVVQARVWYEGYGECPLKSEKLVLSGQETKCVYLQTPWSKIRLQGNEHSGYAQSQNSSKERIFQTFLGIWGVVVDTQQEQRMQKDVYTESQAVSIARDRALKDLAARLQASQPFNDCKVEVLSSPSDPILRVKVSVEILEDIGVAQPFSSGENSN